MTTLGLGTVLEGVLGDADTGLRPAAEAMGLAVLPHLERLRPRVVEDVEDPVLETIDLEHEGPPDPLSLVACLAAHRLYVTRRGRSGAVSPGALAIARILVWAERAALIGAPPELLWIGPPARAPERTPDRVALSATCAVASGGGLRRAAAVAHLRRPPREGGTD